MRNIALNMVLFFVSLNVCAQTAVSGSIIDSEKKEPLPYVNIGIVGKTIGTVSDLEGTFSLEIPSTNDDEIMRVSMIGYETQEFTVEKFKEKIQENPQIVLDKKTTELKEVIVSGKELKTKVLGNKTKSQMTSAGFESDMLGNEVGLIIKIKKSPTIIKDFNCSIVRNEYGTVRFRLNVYDLKDGMPNNSLLKENIIVETDIEKGLLTVDLSQYNIVVEDDFFIGLEWIEDLGTDGLFFSAAFFAKPIIYKETSHSNWQKVGVAGLGFSVTVRY